MKTKYIPLLLALLLLTGCTAKTPEATSQIFAMDTVMDFYAVGEGAEDTLTAAAQEINRLEALLSRTRQTSEISAINSGDTVTVSAETAALLQRSVQFAALTGGAFDVTVEPLVSAWGIHTESPKVLTDDELAALLPLVGSHHLRIDGTQVTLDAGCSIDLGAIAKGYASDRVAQLFRDYGVEGGWISLGGNVYAHGTKEGGKPWNVAIRDPQNTGGSAAMVALSNQFAVTSGGYQRYFTAEDGTVYQHIIDPATGKPAVSDLLSVTIICADGTMADAYSTALYVMGLEGAKAFWQQHAADFDMVLITTDNRLFYTPGLEGKLTVSKGGAYEAQRLS
jgi:thiamine biosynthesis lipoprotein